MQRFLESLSAPNYKELEPPAERETADRLSKYIERSSKQEGPGDSRAFDISFVTTVRRQHLPQRSDKMRCGEKSKAQDRGDTEYFPNRPVPFANFSGYGSTFLRLCRPEPVSVSCP